MKVDFESAGNVLVVRVEGELDLSTAPQFRASVEHALDRTMARDCILNMKGVSFIDSSGLGAILGRYRRVTQAGGKMALCGVIQRVRPILELSGIKRIMPLYDSEKEALASLQGD
ncbi:MAG: anti-sigma F factor antagonist [Firmicutes bacterium]|nr:anti-sigma F factor antagonist [Bacillota bacterium]